MEWDKIGYEVGWDFASFNRPLPPNADDEVQRGFQGFQHGGHRHVRRGDLFERKWLQIRFSAYRRRKEFDPRITPSYIRDLMPNEGLCPVTREKLTFGELAPSDWSIERVNNDKGYVPANLIVISVRANEAKGSHSAEEIRRFASGKDPNTDLTTTEWKRLYGLIEPMVPDENGKVQGVTVMHGQRVAPGMPMSGIAFFQHLVGSYAMMMKDGRLFAVGNHLLAEMCDCMCRKNKVRSRAFTRLVKAAVKRANVVQHEDQIWATPRVQRMLVEFANLVGGSDKGEEFFKRLESFSRKLDAIDATGRQSAALSKAALRQVHIDA